MHPILFQAGPITLYSYGFMIALGLLLGLKIAVLMARKERVDREKAEENLSTLLFYIVIGGLIGGRLNYVLVYWDQFAGSISSIFKIWEGGLVFYGGLIGASAGIVLWVRNHSFAPWRKVLDWISPGIAFGHALGRVGCFLAGCCYGKPTDKFWSVTFENPHSLAPLGISLHPTQIYESLFLISLGFFLIFRIKSRRNVPGALFADYLAIYSFGRFFLEFLRGDDPRMFGLTPGQIVSIFIFAFSFFFRRKFLSSGVIEVK